MQNLLVMKALGGPTKQHQPQAMFLLDAEGGGVLHLNAAFTVRACVHRVSYLCIHISYITSKESTTDRPVPHTHPFSHKKNRPPRG